MEPEQEGMSTSKKVVAGAAVGVAIPAAVEVAKKILGDSDEQGETEDTTARRRGSASGRSRSTSRPRRSRPTRSRSSSAKSRSGSSSGSRRTKEQLYATAKRLNIEGSVEDDEGSARAGRSARAALESSPRQAEAGSGSAGTTVSVSSSSAVIRTV